MGAKQLNILTPSGCRYVCDIPSGNIRQYGGTKWGADHKSWKILGFERIGPFNRTHFIPLSDIPKLLESGEPLRFRNGKPKFTVRDIDHGTTRIWGNWNHHGVGQAWISC